VYELLSVLLLLSIGMKGGMAMSGVPVTQLSVQLSAVAVMGLVTGLTAFGLLLPARGSAAQRRRLDRRALRLGQRRHLCGGGGVSWRMRASFEEYVAAFVVVLEVPAILLGIVLARGTAT
jgi:uncharacterized protein